MMARKEVSEQHKIILSKIGDELFRLRQSTGRTIEGTASEINVSRNGLAKMEVGQTYFNLSTLLHILDHYKVDHLDFFKNL